MTERFLLRAARPTNGAWRTLLTIALAAPVAHLAYGSSDDSSMPVMDIGAMMDSMQGGSAPPDARDSNAYADGLNSGMMPGMDMADNALYEKLLLDQLEYQRSDDAEGAAIDAQAWYGGDDDKLWIKADGGFSDGRLEATRTEALWGHAIAPYWDTQFGFRHDFGGGPGRNFAAFGVQGLSRYWFDVEATAYLGESGRTAARLELEYELLFTQRLILQPNLEFNLYGKDDPSRDIGAGLSSIDFGLRLRYEIARKFAPYIGVNWARKFGKTGKFARASGDDVQDTQLVAGVRLWF